MLSCKDITELLTEYLEGEMSLAGRVQVRMHMTMCGHCRTYLKQLKLTIDSCGRIPPPEITEDLREELLTTFREWKAGGVDSSL